MSAERTPGVRSGWWQSAPGALNPGVAYRIGLVLVIAALALAMRFAVLPFESGDYRFFLLPWYEFIEDHGGFAALRHKFSDYNMPYLYLLASLTYLPVSPLVGIKLISVAFDLVTAYFTFRLVALRHPGTWLPHLASIAVVLLPTVIVNGAFWGQADSIYTAFGLGGLYFALRHRPWWACVFFGLALAFKLQIVFLFPVLLLLALTGRLPWRTLLAIPAVYLALDVPALLIGADPAEVLLIYARQTETYSALTLNAPSVYQFVPANAPVELLRTLGVLFTAGAVLALLLVILASRVSITPTRVVLAATAFTVLVPYFLPAMHERYFYLADVLTVITAFYLPKLRVVPLLVQFASFFSYMPFLFEASVSTDAPPSERVPVDLRVLAVLMLLALVLLLRELFHRPSPAPAPALSPPRAQPVAQPVAQPRVQPDNEHVSP